MKLMDKYEQVLETIEKIWELHFEEVKTLRKREEFDRRYYNLYGGDGYKTAKFDIRTLTEDKYVIDLRVRVVLYTKRFDTDIYYNNEIGTSEAFLIEDLKGDKLATVIAEVATKNNYFITKKLAEEFAVNNSEDQQSFNDYKLNSLRAQESELKIVLKELNMPY